MTTGICIQPPSKLAWRVAELAKALGISPRTIWTEIETGRLQVARSDKGGRFTLIPREAVEAWLQRRRDRAAMLLRLGMPPTVEQVNAYLAAPECERHLFDPGIADAAAERQQRRSAA